MEISEPDNAKTFAQQLQEAIIIPVKKYPEQLTHVG